MDGQDAVGGNAVDRDPPRVTVASGVDRQLDGRGAGVQFGAGRHRDFAVTDFAVCRGGRRAVRSHVHVAAAGDGCVEKRGTSGDDRHGSGIERSVDGDVVVGGDIDGASARDTGVDQGRTAGGNRHSAGVQRAAYGDPVGRGEGDTRGPGREIRAGHDRPGGVEGDNAAAGEVVRRDVADSAVTVRHDRERDAACARIDAGPGVHGYRGVARFALGLDRIGIVGGDGDRPIDRADVVLQQHRTSCLQSNANACIGETNRGGNSDVRVRLQQNVRQLAVDAECGDSRVSRSVVVKEIVAAGSEGDAPRVIDCDVLGIDKQSPDRAVRRGCVDPPVQLDFTGAGNINESAIAGLCAAARRDRAVECAAVAREQCDRSACPMSAAADVDGGGARDQAVAFGRDRYVAPICGARACGVNAPLSPGESPADLYLAAARAVFGAGDVDAAVVPGRSISPGQHDLAVAFDQRLGLDDTAIVDDRRKHGGATAGAEHNLATRAADCAAVTHDLIGQLAR